MYFEKQGFFSSLCCVHATNNLLGINALKEKDFDMICEDLARSQKQQDPQNYKWNINPHKHPFGGDYDVNVLTIALQKLNFTCQWIDKRTQFDNRQRQKAITGYIINIEKKKRFYHSLTNLSNRHWVAIKKFEGEYFLLDSQKSGPIKIQELNSYINKQMSKGSCVFEVKRKK